MAKIQLKKCHVGILIYAYHLSDFFVYFIIFIFIYFLRGDGVRSYLSIEFPLIHFTT